MSSPTNRRGTHAALPLLNLDKAGLASSAGRRKSAPVNNRSPSAQAPVIQICTENVPTPPLSAADPLDGIDNQAFVDDILEELRGDQESRSKDVISSKSHPIANSANVEPQKLTVPTQVQAGLLPGRKRNLNSLTLTDSFSLDADDGFFGAKTGTAPLSPGSLSTRTNWSELKALARKDSSVSIGSYNSEYGESKLSPSGISSAMSQRIKELVERFVSRTEHFKEKAIQPPTPSSSSLGSHSALSAVSEPDPEARTNRLESFVPIPSQASGGNPEQYTFINIGRFHFKIPNLFKRFRKQSTVDPTSKIYICWLFIVTAAFSYNAIAIPLRAAFTDAEFYNETITITEKETITCNNEKTTAADMPCLTETKPVTREVPKIYRAIQNEDNRMQWWIVDYLADLIYLLDILVMRMHVSFISDGLPERSKKKIITRYLMSKEFKLDFLGVIPTDLLYFIDEISYNPAVRINRLLKIRVMWELYDRLDTIVTSSHTVRVARTLTYMLFLIHLESCLYYVVSAYEKLGYNSWVYNGEGTAYVRCMYLATKTATSIGNNPKPMNQLEYGFMTIYWLSGVFVFAMLIGQIRDIFTSANAAKDNYKKTMDKTLEYLVNLNMPKQLQDRVRCWFIYNWEHQKTLNENSLLEALPMKMKADLCIHVHYNTLSKVQLFQDCEKNLLYDLVLKLNPVLYLPGDYICKKGEVGTEMYIVMHGHVEVVGGPKNTIVFATLYEGSVFGEISLLALAGGNRRTADVRSKGFSQLFLLSKVDFQEAMSNYPAAYAMLKRRAKKLLAQNAKTIKKAQLKSDEVIKNRVGTPKLVHTVVQAVGLDSQIPDYLGMRRRSSKIEASVHDDTNADLLSLGDDFEEELLVVETTERPLTAVERSEEADMTDSTSKEVKRPATAPPAKMTTPRAKQLAMEDLARNLQASPASLNIDLISIFNSPSKDKSNEEQTTILPTVKVESEGTPTAGTPTKKSHLSPITKRKSSKNDSRDSSASSHSSITLKRSNKVSPAIGFATGKGLPVVTSSAASDVAENTVTCHAEIHSAGPKKGENQRKEVLVGSQEKSSDNEITEPVSDEAIKEATDIIQQAIDDIDKATYESKV